MSFAGINATVLQKNNETYFCDPCGNFGQILNIPCGSNAAQAQPGITWAQPVKDGYVQGFRYVVQDAAPTFDSIQVFKLTNLLNGDFYWVVGNQAQYYVQCAACCDASPIPTYITDLSHVDIAPDQFACTDDGVNYDAFFSVPTLATGKYVATVTQNGTGVLGQTFANGSTTIANLIIYLNAHAGIVGVWSNPSGNIIKVVSTTAKRIGFIGCIQTS